MRVVIDIGSSEDQRTIECAIRQVFPDASIVPETGRSEADSSLGLEIAQSGPLEIAELSDSNLRAAALFPLQNPNPVFRVAADGTILFANHASQILLTAWDMTPDKPVPPEWREVVQKALRTGRTLDLTVACDERIIDLSFIPMQSEAYVNVYGREETEHRRQIEADRVELDRLNQHLAAERDVLRAVMDNTATQLAYLDRDFNFIEVNTAYAIASGHSREALIGRNHFDLFPYSENQAIFARVRDTGVPVECHAKPFEYASQPERGVTYWDWTLAPVVDAGGTVQGLVFSLHDVTENVRANLQREEDLAALRQSEEKYRNLFTGMREGFAIHEIILDASGKPCDYRFLDANPAFGELTGLEPAAILGRTVLEVLPETEDYWIGTYGKVAVTGEPVRFENYSQAIGKWFEVVAYRPAMGQFATLFTDITERRQSEEALRRARDDLEVRVKERTEQLKSLSHRLVNLQEVERHNVANQLYNDEGQRLATLILELGQLQKESYHRDPGADARIARMRELADGVLRDMHSLAVNLRPASLDQLGLAHALQARLQQFGAAHGIEVVAEVAGLLGVTLSSKIETNLYRIVEEALENVARHAQATIVGVVLSRSNSQITAIVEDNGIGFDVDNAIRNGRCGLLSMRERAEMIEGSVTIESRPGRGTTVYIEVPLVPEKS